MFCGLERIKRLVRSFRRIYTEVADESAGHMYNVDAERTKPIKPISPNSNLTEANKEENDWAQSTDRRIKHHNKTSILINKRKNLPTKSIVLDALTKRTTQNGYPQKHTSLT